MARMVHCVKLGREAEGLEKAPFKGDLDGMVKRRVIRVLTVQNPVLYFVDRGREVGIISETIKAFEKQLNDKLKNKVVTVHVIAICTVFGTVATEPWPRATELVAGASTIEAAPKAVPFVAKTVAL